MVKLCNNANGEVEDDGVSMMILIDRTINPSTIDCIQRIQDNFKPGIGVYRDIIPDTPIAALRSNYNIMVEKDLWARLTLLGMRSISS